MNNLFKIFLIINLVSSATSANNHSLPLPEENLMVGQNSSELTKREEPITVHGGINVIGFTPSGRELCQRHCTLSFPVSLNNDKGYLTSFVCASSSVLVVDPHSVQVGHVSGSYNYKPEQGLEYAFVSIYDDYWSDKISRKIDYSHCASTGRGIVDIDEFIPVFPVPSQPLNTDSTVCAYGGKSKLACGEIVESGVTITVHVPGSCEKETAQFHDVIKVRMNKPCLRDDLGAPVYIPLPIPNSTQIIANPVGQVVENVEGPIEENI
jgi:hypothetical protein